MISPIPTDRALILLTLPAPGISDLGYANGWVETPAVVEKCQHKPPQKEIGRCLREVRCEICNYKYKIDSGG